MLKPILFALACLALAGCIKQPAADSVPVTAAEFPSDPIVELPPVELPPDPMLEIPQPVPDPISTYTGVRVYGDAETCNPCRNLHDDIVWLCKNHGWTWSDSVRKNADWQFLPCRESDERIPLIEFWDAGKMRGATVGYSDTNDAEERRTALIDLVRQHPRGRR